MTRRTTRAHGASPFRSPGLLRSLSTAGCAVAVLLVGGCVATDPMTWIQNGFKVGPNYGRPPAPIAPEWIEANDARVQGRQLRDGDWWNVFGDSTLNSLIHTAYQQNPNLRAVGTRVLQARAQQAIAAGNLFPQTQEATGSCSRVNLSRNAFNNPSAFASASPFPTPPGAPLGNFYSDWTAGFNLSWELDFWGRYRRAIESANGSLDASVENYDDALVTLLADVATNYVQFRVAQQRIKIARDNIRKQADLVAKAEQQAQVGTGTKLDLEQLRTLLEQTRSTVPALQVAQGQANDTLCILLGEPPHDLEPELGPGPELGSEPMPNTPAWVAAGIPADLLRRRPDVQSAERQAAAQSAQIGVAEADLYPTIFINGTLGWEAPDISKLFESNSFFGTITPNFRWNILNYGRIVNNVHLQQAKTQELIATYQSKVPVGGPGSPDRAAGLLAVSGTGPRPGPERNGGRGGHEDRGTELRRTQGRRESAVHSRKHAVAGAGPTGRRAGRRRPSTDRRLSRPRRRLADPRPGRALLQGPDHRRHAGRSSARR